MAYWIFVVTNHQEYSVTGEDVLKQRTQDKFWGLGESTPNRKGLKEGDSIVFYLGNPAKAFVGTAVLVGPSYQLSAEQSEELSHGNEFFRSGYGVRLKDINLWSDRRLVEPLVSNLSFIQNKKSWGPYFQGGVRSIPEQDFQVITGAVEIRVPASSIGALEGSEFALEAHLEDFMDKNWDLIDFGRRLERYKTEEQDGRQFPAAEWSIDFLCTDKDTGDFVVVELKRGRSSDSVIGQILRYMTWVRENLARPGQSTRGIVVTAEADKAMLYAARAVPDISLFEYKVDFKLKPVKVQ